MRGVSAVDAGGSSMVPVMSSVALTSVPTPVPTDASETAPEFGPRSGIVAGPRWRSTNCPATIPRASPAAVAATAHRLGRRSRRRSGVRRNGNERTRARSTVPTTRARRWSMRARWTRSRSGGKASSNEAPALSATVSRNLRNSAARRAHRGHVRRCRAVDIATAVSVAPDTTSRRRSSEGCPQVRLRQRCRSAVILLEPNPPWSRLTAAAPFTACGSLAGRAGRPPDPSTSPGRARLAASVPPETGARAPSTR